MSFNVMFVDDEPWALKGISGIIQWDRYGFNVVGKYEDSVEAFEDMRLNRPDAVFVDIRMPCMSGIELMKRAREEGMKTEFVVVSGFRDFKYAQEAMDYGAFSYIVKPLNREIMKDIAHKLYKRLNDSRKLISDKIALSLYSENLFMENDHDIELKLNDLVGKCSSKALYVALIEDFSDGSGGITCLYKDFGESMVKTGKNKYFLLMENGELPDYISKEGDCSGFRFNVGLSTAFQEAGDIERALREARMAFYSRFVTGKCSIYRYKTADTKQIGTYIDEIKRAYHESDIKKVMTILADFCDDASRSIMGIENVVFFYNQIMAMHISNYPLEITSEFVFMDYAHLCNSYTSLRSLCDNICSLARELLIVDLDTLPLVQEHNDIQPILEYVQENFEKEIYLDEIAGKFHISPSHFSRMFKKAAGKTFTQYLLEMRMSKACRLIKSTDMSISSVAESVGFSDYFYFNKMFKKYSATTPLKYRKGEEADDKI